MTDNGPVRAGRAYWTAYRHAVCWTGAAVAGSKKRNLSLFEAIRNISNVTWAAPETLK